MANQPALPNMQPNTGQDSPETPFNVLQNAWTINNWPPVMKSHKGSNTQTSNYELDNGNAQPIPFSQVKANDSNSTTSGWLTFQKLGRNGSVGSDGTASYWDVFGGTHIYLGIKSPCPYDVNLIFEMRVRNEGVNSESGFFMYINTQPFTPASGQNSTNTEWHKQTIPIPSSWLQGMHGINNITIEPTNKGMQIRSVTLQVSENKKLVPIKAAYFWEVIYSNTVWVGPVPYPTKIKNGAAWNESEPFWFIRDLGYPSPTSNKLATAYSETTESLNAAFSVTQSSENSIDLFKETSTESNFSFEIPDNATGALSFQIWQLITYYEVMSGDNARIEKRHGENIFIRTYCPTSSSAGPG